MSKVNEVNASNCVNATEIRFSQVFTTTSLTSGAEKSANGDVVWRGLGMTMAAVTMALLLL